MSFSQSLVKTKENDENRAKSTPIGRLKFYHLFACYILIITIQILTFFFFASYGGA